MKYGTGTLTFTGPNAYSSGMIINGGTLSLGNNSALPANGYLTVSNGSTVDLGTYSTNLLTTVNLNNGTIRNGTLNASSGFQLKKGTVSAILSGGAALTKSTSDTVILSGANSYTGGTTINTGTLSVAGTSNVGTGVLTINGGILDLTGSTFNKAITLGNNGGTINVGDGLSVSDNQVISGNALTKTGLGTLALSGANNFTGGTTISGGTLSVAGSSNLGSDGLTFNGGTLEVTGSGAINKAIKINSSGTIQVDSGVSMSDNQVVNDDYATTGLAGSLTKTGSGTLTLNGSSSNTYSGMTTVVAGTLNLAKTYSAKAIADGGLIVDVNADSFSGALVKYTGTSTNMMGTGPVTINNQGTFDFNGISDTIGNMTIQGNTSHAGQIINSQTGQNGGTLTVGQLTFVGGGTITLQHGKLGLSGNNSFGDVIYNKIDTSGTTAYIYASSPGEIDLNGDRTFNIENDPAISYEMCINADLADGSKSSGLTKSGAGGLSLGGGGASSGGSEMNRRLYWDSTAIPGGGSIWDKNAADTYWHLGSATGPLTAWIDGADAIFGACGDTPGAITIDDSADPSNPISPRSITFQHDGYALVGKTNDDAISLSPSGTTFEITGMNDRAEIACKLIDATYSAGALKKTGLGTLIFSGEDIYAGDTLISAGTLQIGNGGTSGNIGLGAIIDNAILNFDRSDDFSVGSISGSGSLTQSGSGTLTLIGDNTYSNGTTIENGTLQLGDGTTNGRLAGGIVDNAKLKFAEAADYLFSGAISGEGAVFVDNAAAATLTLSGTRSYTGGTTLDSGNLSIPGVTIITTLDQLQSIPANTTGSYLLVKDIDASATAQWNGGAGFAPLVYFGGNFDGGRHVISGLTINRPTTDLSGLFGYTAVGSSVHDVGLANENIFGKWYTGGLIGRNWGTVWNCFTSGTILANTGYAGADPGTSGYNPNGQGYIGGLVGFNSGTIRTCFSAANVSTQGAALGQIGIGGFVGGLVGVSQDDQNQNAIIADCYATGNVSAKHTVGGLVGAINLSDANYTAVVDNCYASGNVTGYDCYIGGAIGRDVNNSPSVSDSFSLGNVTCLTNGVGTFISIFLNGAQPPVNSYYNQDATYLLYGDANGAAATTVAALGDTGHNVYHGSTPWDFEHTWIMVDGLPKLRAWVVA